MSIAPASSDVEVVEEEAPPPPINSVRGMVLDPAVRNYLFTGFAALIMIFLVMLSNGSDIGGLILALLGAGGMVFRWPAMPTFFLLILLYFLVFPYGDPTSAYASTLELRRGHFRIADVFLVFSVIVYLASHYRIYGIAANGLPYESRRYSRHARRPTYLIRAGEIPRFLYIAGVVVIFGQFAWLLTTSIDADVNADFPLHFADDSKLYGRRAPGSLYLFQLRLLVLFGLGFFGILLARVIFGYWRLRLMSADEGSLALLEANWGETHRERVRVETWRKWQQEREKKRREKAEQTSTAPRKRS